MSVSTEALEELTKLCLDIHKDFPNAIYFMGKLVFHRESWYYHLLHNETAYQLQRRLHFSGLDAIVLSVRVGEVANAIS
jgi:hypothetical protein